MFREKWKLKPYTESMIQKIALWDCKAAKFGYGKEPKETLRQCCTRCVKCQNYQNSDQYTQQYQTCNLNYTMPNENQTRFIEPSLHIFL